MDIHVKILDPLAVVELVGELDAKTSPQAGEYLLALAQPKCRIVLDMAKVTYMSSAGLRMFLLVHRKISSQDGALALLGLPVRDFFAARYVLHARPVCQGQVRTVGGNPFPGCVSETRDGRASVGRFPHRECLCDDRVWPGL